MRPIPSAVSSAVFVLAFCLGAGIASAQSSGGGAAISGDTYSMLDQRINALEQQIRDLNSQVEKATFTNNQLQSKLDRMDKDYDQRFKDLEQKANGTPGQGQGQTGANGAPVLVPPSDQGNAEAGWNPTMGSPPGNLGQVPVNDLKKAQAAANGNAAAAPVAKGGVLPGKTSQEQYDYAFGLLRNNDYDGANNAFKLFVQQHSQDPLAGNAMYWLGQIPFSQGDYDKAAPLFFEAYRKYPRSAKAGESLLKVGLSFDNLDKKKEACAAITHFLSEFPDAADNLHRQAVQEKSKLRC